MAVTTLATIRPLSLRTDRMKVFTEPSMYNTRIGSTANNAMI